MFNGAEISSGMAGTSLSRFFLDSPGHLDSPDVDLEYVDEDRDRDWNMFFSGEELW